VAVLRCIWKAVQRHRLGSAFHIVSKSAHAVAP
jgi:hypothetical protein